MKSIIHIVLGFILITLFTACNNNSKQYHSLKIVVDSTFDYRILDSAFLSSNNFISVGEHIYDTINKNYYFQWDSLPSENYSFRIQTIFTKHQQFTFSLNSDTSFAIKNQLGINYVDYISKNDLLNATQIELIYTSSGCFHNYIETSILIKNKFDNSYSLHTISNTILAGSDPLNIKKKISANVIHDLVELINKSEKMRSASNEFLIASTTTRGFDLLVNEKLYHFDDRGIEDWKLYHDFRTKYITLKEIS